MGTHVEHLSHMGHEYRPRGGGRKGAGLAVVVVLHLLIGWALVSGLARKAVEVVKKPIQMVVLPEAVPPDVAPPVQQNAPVIQAVQAEPPAVPPVIAPPAPPAPPAPVVQRAEVGVACPGYQKVLQGALGGAFEAVGIEGTVKVLLRVRGHQVVDVAPQAGPKAYYRYVVAAAKKMNCSATGADELLVPLDVVFREE